MAAMIKRLYASSDKAEAAVKALKDNRIGDNEIVVCGPSAGATKDALVMQLGQAGLNKAQASPIADEILKGKTFVGAAPPFGSGRRVETLLDRYEPAAVLPTLPSNGASPMASMMPAKGQQYDDAAPLSSTFNWQTSYDDPAPLSNYFKFPLLSDFSCSRRFGFNELSDEPAPLSKALGWSLLRDDPAPLSNKFNWPLLRD